MAEPNNQLQELIDDLQADVDFVDGAVEFHTTRAGEPAASFEVESEGSDYNVTIIHHVKEGEFSLALPQGGFTSERFQGPAYVAVEDILGELTRVLNLPEI